MKPENVFLSKDKTNIEFAPENEPFATERKKGKDPLPTIIFQGLF